MATIDKRVTKGGGDRWRVRIRRRGYRETESFDSREKAERWAREVERAIDRGDWHQPGDGDERRFDQLVDHYLVSDKRSSDTRRQLGWWKSHLGSDSATSISRRRILTLRDRLLRQELRPGRFRSPATVNRYVSGLSALFTWGLRQGWVDHHPVRGIRPLQEDNGRARFLSDEERRRLLESCRSCGGARLHALVTLAISIGARRGELLQLRWSDIDLHLCTVEIGGNGSRTRRTLPLPPAALETLVPLSKVRRIGGDEVFSDPVGKVVFPRRAWEAALRDSEIEDFRFHDLRHTAAAYLAECGASLSEIAEFLGHGSLHAVQRYAHLTSLRSAVGVGRLHRRLFARDL